MHLTISKTEYNLTYDGHDVKIIISEQDGKGELDFFIDGRMAYYHIIYNIFNMSVMSEEELLRLAYSKMTSDRSRWICDCSIIEEHYRQFELKSKVVIYKGVMGSNDFILRVSANEGHGGTYMFNLEYSNFRNNDTMHFHIEAKDHADLAAKLNHYAQGVALISREVEERQEEVASIVFPLSYRRR